MPHIGKATLEKAKSIYAANKKITKEEMAQALGLSQAYIVEAWALITGKHRSNNTARKRSNRALVVAKARNIFLQNPNVKPEEIAQKVGKSRSYIVSLWSDITGYRYSKKRPLCHVSSVAENIPYSIKIPDFVPKAKPFVDRNGKECTDVSEFFGIVENGGECYKNVRYTIPKGDIDSYNGFVSDVYI